MPAYGCRFATLRNLCWQSQGCYWNIKNTCPMCLLWHGYYFTNDDLLLGYPTIILCSWLIMSKNKRLTASFSTEGKPPISCQSPWWITKASQLWNFGKARDDSRVQLQPRRSVCHRHDSCQAGDGRPINVLHLSCNWCQDFLQAIAWVAMAPWTRDCSFHFALMLEILSWQAKEDKWQCQVIH